MGILSWRTPALLVMLALFASTALAQQHGYTPGDIEEGGKQLTYEEVGRRYGMKATDVTNYLSYARKEFRRIVLEELRAMTASEEEFRREARTLLGVSLA
jgi:hypothetical protein